jgi:hypothetical protein
MTADTDTPKKHSEWLLMVYAAGDNNLSANSIALMQDLEAANHREEVRVLAAFDSATPIPQGARYLEINRALGATNGFRSIHWPLHNDLLTPDNGVVTPDFCAPPGRAAGGPTQFPAEQAFARFLDFASANYVADKYMLILFGHGTLVAGNTFLADTNPPSFLNLNSFANILRKHFHHKIDILGFANCEMNGIETAVQLHGQVDFTIGSQGLVLALGWPFRRIVETVGENHNLNAKELTKKILRVCARNVLDFTLMERSSEQAICDVTKFGSQGKLLSAVRELSGKLQTGLAVKPDSGEIRFPVVRDVVRLARLEAQAYFNEVFVDLYDFCELLVLKCNDALGNLNSFVSTLFVDAIPNDVGRPPEGFKKFLLGWPDLNALSDIATASWHVLEAFREEAIVPDAYYVCPELQYSHGISIYFPWTLPQNPITFEPAPGSGSRPTEFKFKTPFDIYKQYEFATSGYGDWSNFLEAFFRATLRNVRQSEVNYKPDDVLFFEAFVDAKHEAPVPAVDLRKSNSTGETDDCTCPPIKNYPRRFYISPADCRKRLAVFGLPGSPEPIDSNVLGEPGKVSYLGWNIRGLVAEVIGVKEPQEPAVENPTPV